ncbi:hypothetical protein PC122_g17509 [Phytophthora cactorum]|nr:hypothetical protein PC122_g17509 [Phytophthora cactorum]
MVTDCLATASTGRSTTVDPTDRTSTVFTDRTIFASTHCFTAGNAAECPTTVSTDCSTADNAAECPTDCSTTSGSSNSFINTSTDCSTAEFSTAVSSLRSDCCSADDFLASDFARCVLGGAVPRRGIARGGPREPDASPDDSKSQPGVAPLKKQRGKSLTRFPAIASAYGYLQSVSLHFYKNQAAKPYRFLTKS